MSRKFWKEDDGIVDLILKIGSILAILVAAHQYYFKIYPVWAKENKLSEATIQLKQVIGETNEFKNQNKFLQVEQKRLSSEVANLELKEDALINSYEAKIEKQKNAARKMRESLYEENTKLEIGLFQAVTKTQKLQIEAVTVHLRRASEKIFQIQLDNIRAFGEKKKLDLKKDALNYVAENKPESQSLSETAALEILEQYALTEIGEGVQEYASITGVSIIFKQKSYAKEILNKLNQ